MYTGLKLELSLFGPFHCEWSNGDKIDIKGAKHRALISMLATAPNGVRTRSWLQEHLWSRSGEELGRQSLRRTLADLRKQFGDYFEHMFETSNIEIKLNLNAIDQVGSPSDGLFVDGLNVNEPDFLDWLNTQRQKHATGTVFLESDSRLEISPSIAVLPFASVNGQGDEAHFGDLVAMDVARALSRSNLIDVISHLSSRQLGGRMIDLTKLRQTLSADYAINGNIRVNDQDYQLDVDFIETRTGRILWSEALRGKIDEVLNGDSVLVERIAKRCGREVLRSAVAVATADPLPNVQSHALFMASIMGMHQHHLSSFSRARQNLEELIKRVPKHSKIYAWLAKWYILAIAQGWSGNVIKDSQTAADYTARGLDLNPECATTLTIDGMIQGDRSEDMSLAVSRFQAATEIDPNQGLAWLMFSRANSFLGQGKSAIALASKARRLSPVDPHGYFYDIMEAMALKVDGDYDGAIKLAERSLAANPRHISSYRLLTMAQQLGGQHEEARKTATILRQLDPHLTVENYLKTHPAGRIETGRTWAQALKDSGIPLK